MKSSQFLAISTLFLATSLLGYDPHANLTKDNKLPKELKDIGFSDVTGKSLNWDLPFQDHTGATLKLSSLGNQGKPILLSPVYFKCPTLCNIHMNGVTKVLRKMDWTAGKEFSYVAFSINPKEDKEVSLPKRMAYLQEYDRKEAENGFFLLTGDSDSIQRLTEDLQFRYRWDEDSQQYIHASGLYVLTPEGKVSRIFQGIDWNPTDLKLALIEASGGKIGTFVDRMALFCFQFDPKKNKYTIYAYRMMQIGGGLTFVVLASFLIVNWRKNNTNLPRGVT